MQVDNDGGLVSNTDSHIVGRQGQIAVGIDAAHIIDIGAERRVLIIRIDGGVADIVVVAVNVIACGTIGSSPVEGDKGVTASRSYQEQTGKSGSFGLCRSIRCSVRFMAQGDRKFQLLSIKRR